MRILISAYACEPGRGSEPEIGLRALIAASRQHEVWLFTRSNNVERLEAFLVDDPYRERIHIIGLELGPRWIASKRRLGTIGVFLYYSAWQRLVRREAHRLMQSVDFDVVHHVTFAILWLPIGVSSTGLPLVLGPVGRGLTIPWRLWSTLGLVGFGFEFIRVVFQLLGRLTAKRRLRDARVVLVQNEEAAAEIAGDTRVIVFPNAAAVGPFEFASTLEPTSDIVVVGRLLPLKGVSLAIRSLVYLSEVTLTILGDGPDRDRLFRLAAKLGVGDRVVFRGSRSRDEAITAIRSHRVLLHPCLREEAGMAVSEALALGTPVVALDRAGPRVLARLWPESLTTLVDPHGSASSVAQRLAEAVRPYLEQSAPRPARSTAPRSEFDEVLLEAYASAGAGG